VGTLKGRWITLIGMVVVATSALTLAAPASAATPVVVSLAFDDNTANQFTLAYQQALQPRGIPATFFVNSGTIGSSKNFMTWSQLGTLAAAGNDIGGKTVHGINLKTTADYQTKVNEVCDDRQALIAHGLDPTTFAYPFGASDQTAKDIVRSCGYGNARSGGGLSPAAAPYAETTPPKDFFATRAYVPSGQTSLANLQALVTNAAANGGGWDQIVVGKVCSKTLDAANYGTCATGAYVELETLSAFLDWVRNAGQAGGAPAGTTFATVASVIRSADTVAPTTTITCDGAPCTTSAYISYTRIALAATDTGSGVSAIRYTTDGTVPNGGSPLYTTPFKVTQTSTVSFRAYDRAGNAGSTRTQAITIDAPPPADTTAPSTQIACDASACGSSPYSLRVSITLTATDTGGSGVDAIYYTTDGTPPTTASTAYAGAFQLTRSAVVRFFSVDRAGNAEQPRSQTVYVNGARTYVAFTWDDGRISQYDVAFKHAFDPQGVHATFYLNSGSIGTAPSMTWADAAAIEAAGSEIGGHTVDHVIVKGLDQTEMTHQICDDRSALQAHGLNPSGFAFPEGAFDAASEATAKNCGYTYARTAGSITLSGPIYAETIPPKDPYAIRAWSTPSARGISLSDLQSLVWNASSHGGGLVPIVGHNVCSETYDPQNYDRCARDSDSIELSTINAFIDWMEQAGEPGGAPGGATLGSVRDAIGPS
jgi:peptidoglycan/xylan/chitin deacetylase (PgdA/CDA1 family)